MCIGLHVKYRYSSQIVMKPKYSRQIFEKHSNLKFYENVSSDSRVFPWRRTDGQIGMTQLIVFFFAILTLNLPKTTIVA